MEIDETAKAPVTDQPDDFTSASCRGERCSLCGEPAARKVGEEMFHDDPNPYRHNLTAYVCKAHFDQIMDRGGFLKRESVALKPCEHEDERVGNIIAHYQCKKCGAASD